MVDNSNKHTGMTNSEIDRISDLPDGVLEHILSFLRTKQAVQTSVLSKRWRNLWAFTSRIDFNHNDFRCSQNFLEFGDKVLCRHETSYLHTFSITCHDEFYDKFYSAHIRQWINTAMKFKPRVCFIEACVPEFDVIDSTFTCESIEDMSITIHRSNNCKSNYDIIPTTINLPYIKRLCLNRCNLNEDTATRLFIGCPVLEDLMLKSCSGEFSSIFRQKLIYLSLIDCHPGTIWSIHQVLSKALPNIVDLPCIRMLCITEHHVDEEGIARLLTGCPILENLSFKNCFGIFSNLFMYKPACSSFWSCNMMTWGDKDWWYIDKISVKLSFYQLLTEPAEVLIESTLHPLQQFIRNTPNGTALNFHDSFDPRIFFSGAERLKLCFPDTEVHWSEQLPRVGKLKNLKSLTLGLADWCMNPFKIDPVIWFIKKSPNIEELTLYYPKREILLSKKGKPKPGVPLREISYCNSLSMELSGLKNLMRVEIKLPKNLFADHSFKKTLIDKIEYFVDAMVVISKFEE